MTITFVAETGNAGASGTEPTGTAAGDILIAAAQSTSSTIAAPSGWTLVGSKLTNNGYTAGVWWIQRGSSAPSYTWTNMAGGSDGVTVATFRGVYGAPIDTSATSAAGATSSPTVTASNSTDWLICVYCDTTATTIAPPSGMTAAGGDTIEDVIAYLALSSSGATGAKAWSGTSAPVGAWSLTLLSAATITAVQPHVRRRPKPTQFRYLRTRTFASVIPAQVNPPTTPSVVRRRHRWRIARKAAIALAAPPQVNPPRIPDRVFRPWRFYIRKSGRNVAPALGQDKIAGLTRLRSRRIPTRRGSVGIAPLAQVVVPPVYPPAQTMPPRRWRALRRAGSAFPVQPQLNPPRLPDRVLRPWRWRIVRRASSSFPVQPQAIPLPPGSPPLRRWRAVRRALSAFPVQSQASPPPPAYPFGQTMPPRRWRAVRRAGSAFPVQPQLNPPRLPDRVLRPWRWRIVRRGATALLVPPQVTPPAPAYPPAQSMSPRRWRAVRRALSAFPVQPQATAPAPTYPPRQASPARRILARVRPRQAGPVAPQDAPQTSVRVPRRLIVRALRRRDVPQAQAAPPVRPPARHPVEMSARRRVSAGPPLAQVAPPSPVPAIAPQRLTRRILRRARAGLIAWLPGPGKPIPVEGPGAGSTSGPSATGETDGPDSIGSIAEE